MICSTFFLCASPAIGCFFSQLLRWRAAFRAALRHRRHAAPLLLRFLTAISDVSELGNSAAAAVAGRLQSRFAAQKACRPAAAAFFNSH